MKSLKGILNLNKPTDHSVPSVVSPVPNVLSAEPQQRYAHSAVAYRDEIGILGGIVNNESHYSLSFMDIYNMASCTWNVVALSGDRPSSASRMSYVQNGKYYLQMGGHCGNESCTCKDLSSKVFQLDLDYYIWKEVVTSTSPVAPIPKRGCGMVIFDNTLIVIGGYGNISKRQSDVFHYVSHQSVANTGWTNEVHVLHLDSASNWAIPDIIGDILPPCQNFTITKINHDSAILFGGYSLHGCLSDTYLLQYNRNKLFVKKLLCEIKPEGRRSHSAVSLTLIGHFKPIVLIMGGQNDILQILDDCWLFNVEKRAWWKINVPPEMAQRKSFTLSAFHLTPYVVRLVAFGGVAEWSREKHSSQQDCLSSTVFLDIDNLCEGMDKLKITPISIHSTEEKSFIYKLFEANEKMQRLYFDCVQELDQSHSDQEAAMTSYTYKESQLKEELHDYRTEIEALNKRLQDELKKNQSLEECNKRIVSVQHAQEQEKDKLHKEIMTLTADNHEVKRLDEIKSEMTMKLEQKDVVINTLEEALSTFQIQAQHNRIDHVREMAVRTEQLNEEQQKRIKAENSLQEIAIAFRVGNELLTEEQRKRNDIERQLQEVKTAWIIDQRLLADEVAARQKYQILCKEQEESIKLLQIKCDELESKVSYRVASRDGSWDNPKLEEPPSQEFFCQTIVQHLKHKCYEFGFGLSIESTELQCLNKTFRDDPTMFLMHIYDRWKQSCCRSFTIKTIIEVLQTLGEWKLASDIMQRL